MTDFLRKRKDQIPRYYVFSNDYEWVREVFFNMANVYTPAFYGNLTLVEEFIVMR